MYRHEPCQDFRPIRSGLSGGRGGRSRAVMAKTWVPSSPEDGR